MSRQEAVYEDPANERMTSSQSVAMVRGYFVMMAGILSCMVMGFVLMFYSITLWGMLIGMIVGGVEAAAIVAGLAGYYYVGVMMPISQGSCFSVQGWESPSLVHGDWLVSEQPLSEIQMDDDDCLMPVRIPSSKLGKKNKPSQNGEGEEELEVIEELRTKSPPCSNEKCTCERHSMEFPVEYGQIYHKLNLQFRTYAYVMIPSNASFRQAVIISPCKIDQFRKITDLIFFKGFPAMASTTFLSVTRVFEMDEHSQFGGPVYIVNFSSWHVELAQQLTDSLPPI